MKAGPPPPRRPRRLFRPRHRSERHPGDNQPDAERRPTDRTRDRLRAARGHPRARSRAQGAVCVRRVERQPPVHAAVLLGQRAPARHRAARPGPPSVPGRVRRRPRRMRRVPGAHDVGDAVRGLDLGLEHHRLLLLERDHAVDRGVRDRAVPLPARRRSRPVLRARPHACAVRDDELGSARGRVRDGRHLCLPASQGRLVGGAPGARGRGQGLPAVARHPVRGRPLPREGTRQGDPPRVGRRRRMGRGEPPVRARRAPRLGGSSSASTRPAWPTGTASGTWRANAPRARRA